MSRRTFRKRTGELVEMPEVSTTQAKRTLGEVLENLSSFGAVLVTHHGKPKAVLLAQEELDALTEERAETLDELSARLDDLLERMQTPTSRRGMEAAFDAGPDELSRPRAIRISAAQTPSASFWRRPTLRYRM